MSNAPALEIDGLVKRYRDTVAVMPVCRLRAERAAVTAILGPNGAGKTCTTIETCEGYPQGGQRNRSRARA